MSHNTGAEPTEVAPFPVKPMLAKAVSELPVGDIIYEPKWDGIRVLAYRRGSDIRLITREEDDITSLFPTIAAALEQSTASSFVLDGELVMATSSGLDYAALADRIAATADTPVNDTATAQYIIFDLLELNGDDVMELPLSTRRAHLMGVAHDLSSPLHVTPATTDPNLANAWFEQFQGAGFDGVMAKPLDGTYTPDKRSQFKMKHHRSIDCVVAGYRSHPEGGVSALLLGLYDGEQLVYIGHCGGFSPAHRRTLASELADYHDIDGPHPWVEGAADLQELGLRTPDVAGRWLEEPDLEWTPTRPDAVVEVTIEDYTAGELRQPARFLRWRVDKQASSCTIDQVDSEPPAEMMARFNVPNAPRAS